MGGGVVSRRVLKWDVPVDDEWHPMGRGPVLHVACQRKSVVAVWTDEHNGTAPDRHVKAFGTGQQIPTDLHAIGSVLDGMFVWHLFGGAR